MNDRDYDALRTLYLNGNHAIIDGKVAKKFAAKGWVEIEVSSDNWEGQRAAIVPATLLPEGEKQFKAAFARRIQAGLGPPQVVDIGGWKPTTLEEVSNWYTPPQTFLRKPDVELEKPFSEADRETEAQLLAEGIRTNWEFLGEPKDARASVELLGSKRYITWVSTAGLHRTGQYIVTTKGRQLLKQHGIRLGDVPETIPENKKPEAPKEPEIEWEIEGLDEALAAEDEETGGG